MKAAIALTAVAGLAVSVNAGSTIGTFGGGAIPDAITSHTNPGVLTLTGVVAGAGNINNLGVAIDLSHTWAGDLEIEITTPGGATADLVYRVGSATGITFGDSSTWDGTYTFRDGGADLWAEAAAQPFGSPLTPGTYGATGLGGAAVSLGGLDGASADGTWTLTIRDWGGGDTGGVTGWSLLNVPSPGTAALFGLAGLAGLRRRK